MFDDHPLILARCDKTDAALEQPLNHAKFWVYLFNLPLSKHSVDIGHKLGNLLGEVLVVQVSKSEAKWQDWILVRVKLDVRRPLMRGALVHLRGNSRIWIEFKYGKLPNFCYLCRVLGYVKRECSLGLESK